MSELIMGDEIISYRQIGNINSSDTYVFIHGSTLTGAAMLPFARHFTENNCIIPDLPGHGGSNGMVRSTMEELSECIDLFLQQLLEQHIISNKITLLGYSLGGAVVYDLVLKKRPEYKRMILLSSGANISEHAPLVNEFKKKPPEEAKIADIFASLFGSGTTPEEQNTVTELFLGEEVEKRVSFTDLVCATAYNKLDRAQEISIPAFIFAGDEDKIITIGCELDLWRNLKNSSIAIVPFRGHTAMFEETEFLVKAIKDFCKKNQ